jgi:hypothetical protein
MNGQKVAGSPPYDPPEAVRSLAHDLRIPLTSVKSCLNLLFSGQAGPVAPDQRHFLDMALRNLDRLDRMVGGMLTVARTRADGIPASIPEVDLGPLLKDAVRLHRVTAAGRGLEIDDAGLPETFPAQVDGDLVVRMLDNVLGNALKYAGAGGRVRVWLENGCARPRSLSGRLARRCGLQLATFNLIVEDNGPGLSSSVRGRIFEPFNSGADPGAGETAGSGLGLSITRRLAEEHGGTVRLISLPGRGTTVWIKLPRNVASARFQKTLDDLDAARSLEADTEVQPLLGMLDLRRCPVGRPEGGSPAEEFLARKGTCGPSGREAYPGLWVATVMDPVNWSRRWALFGARKGGGLETAGWEYMTFENQEERSLTSSFGEQLESMVNPAHDGPNIG